MSMCDPIFFDERLSLSTIITEKWTGTDNGYHSEHACGVVVFSAIPLYILLFIFLFIENRDREKYHFYHSQRVFPVISRFLLW